MHFIPDLLLSDNLSYKCFFYSEHSETSLSWRLKWTFPEGGTWRVSEVPAPAGLQPTAPHTALLVARRTGNLSMWGAGAQGAPQTVWSLVPRPQATKATGRLQVVCEFATWTRGATQSPSLTAS